MANTQVALKVSEMMPNRQVTRRPRLVPICRLCISFHEMCASRAGRLTPPKGAFESRIARNFRRPKDTRHSRSENGAYFHPNPASGELSPVPFEGGKPTSSRGNWAICEEKSQIAQTLRLYGGPGRDRTDDLFHAMEARSQLRHRPTFGGTTLLLSRLAGDKSISTL
jgi:hypothetical protein